MGFLKKNEDRTHTDAWRHHPFIVIGVDTYIVVLEIEGILAELDMFELVFVEVWPTPQSSVDDMRKAFSPCYLQRYTNGGGLLLL